MRTLWRSPVPSTEFLNGAEFQKKNGRQYEVAASFEQEDDEILSVKLLFSGVQAFCCTHLYAFDDSKLIAYDSVVDAGNTEWLSEVQAQLEMRGKKNDGLRHLMLLFDDGPCYEFLCADFSVSSDNNGI